MQCACCGQRLPKTPSAKAVVSAEYPGLPVSEMLARGWLGDDTTVRDADDLRCRLRRFFKVETESQLRLTLGMSPPDQSPTPTP